MAKKFLTLDIGASSVTLAEFELGGRGALTLLRYGSAKLAAALDSGDAGTILTPAIMEIVREKGIRPGPVAIAVSGQMVFPKFAAIPHTGDDAKFDQMVLNEIEQNSPFPVDEMICDRQILGDTPDGDKAVMMVSAKVDQIEAITAAVASVGFTPEIVDVAPFAYTSAVRHCHPDEGECVVLLDVGAKTTSLVIAEGEKIYNRSIPVAGNTITKDIAQALGCSFEEAEALKLEKGYVSAGGVTEDEDETVERIAKVCRTVLTRLNAEISRSINFYRSQQGGGAPVRLYLTGGTALLPQIDAFFAESLGVEVVFFSPFDRIAAARGLDTDALAADAMSLAPCTGLALHAANLASLTVNLLPPALIAARAEKAKVPFVAFGGAALVAALALAWLGVCRDGDVLGAKADAVNARLDVLRNFETQVAAATKAADAAQADAEAMRRLLASRGQAVARLNAVRGALSSGMWIERWEAGRVTIRGWKDRLKPEAGKTSGEVVVEKLKANPAVDAESVKISDMTTLGKNANVEQFTVEVKFK